jgi:hypothetical protein
MGEPDRAHGRHPTDVRARYAPPAVVAGLVLAAGAAVLTLRTFDFPETSRGHPLVVLGGATVLLALSALKNRQSLPSQASPAAKPTFDARVPVFFGIWLLYPIALMAAGFLGSTIVALAASLSLLGIKRRWAWAAGTVPVTLMIFALLQVVLNIALPQSAADRLVADFLYGLRG